LDRVLGHLDLDYFYAQVEEVEDPSLKSEPVVVCVFSGRTEDSGVVSTSNYKARQYGVKSGMPIALAKRRLRGISAAFIKMDHGKYELYSHRVMEIVKGQVDGIEHAGIDEAFFELTKRADADYDDATALVKQLKARIFSEEKLTCSVGVGPTRIVAKMASDFKKPDGLTVITKDRAAGFLAPLPIEKLYGVGPKTAALLQARGIKTIGNLADFQMDRLEDLVGRKFAIYLHEASNCVDEVPIVERQGSMQLSRIVTLKHDTQDLDQIIGELTPALRDLNQRLVSKNLFFKSVSAVGILKNLAVRTRSKTLETPTNDYNMLLKEVRELFSSLLQLGDLRRAGVRVSELEERANQRSLAEFAN